jgi:uncharacterized phage protein gp47/JayE
MALNIKPSTSIERKLLITETILNSTDKVSKISDESILSGIAGGLSKVTGKAEKDILLAVSQLFPDTAFGDQLDQVAANFGIAPRFGQLGSSTYVRISGTSGTQYLAGTHTFISTSGISFSLDQNVTVPSFGFTYAKVSSVELGGKTNVDPLTISQVSPQPSGHLNVVNEYRADGGRDEESDEIFRIRIKDGANILARGTIAMLEQRFISINNKVLKIYHNGTDLDGKVILSIATQNGSDLNQTELDELLTQSAEYFTLNEYKPYGTNFYGVKLQNVNYGYVDISFRCKLNVSFDPDEVRKQIQINISKYLDPRFFDNTRQKVEWDNLLEIVKNVPGIEYVPDQYFYPRTDIFFANAIPRLRGFLMLDLEGQVISDFQGILSPQYYPNIADFSYIATVLNEIS